MSELQPIGSNPGTFSAAAAELAAFRPALRDYFRKRVASREVEDLVQDVFLNMLARRAAARIENVKAYTFSVAANVLCRHLSHTRRYAIRAAGEAEHAGAPSAEHEVLAAERLLRMTTAVAALPPRARVVFCLHRFEEITYPIIARQLGITVSAVEKHMMNALKALREAATEG
jgi:RNA polymerase sigma-70 factor (ECF subfamily)